MRTLDNANQLILTIYELHDQRIDPDDLMIIFDELIKECGSVENALQAARSTLDKRRAAQKEYEDEKCSDPACHHPGSGRLH